MDSATIAIGMLVLGVGAMLLGWSEGRKASATDNQGAWGGVVAVFLIGLALIAFAVLFFFNPDDFNNRF